MTSLPAKWALDAVDRWADGYHMIREIGLVENGRLDAVLVPTAYEASCARCRKNQRFWDRLGLVGVEVKVSRPDFLRGLKEGQFERYAAELIGLYVVTPLDVAKTKELPDGIGHLVLRPSKAGRRRDTVSCRRHPKWRDADLTTEQFWRLLLRMQDEHREALADARYRKGQIAERVGHLIGSRVEQHIRKIESAVEQEVGG